MAESNHEAVEEIKDLESLKRLIEDKGVVEAQKLIKAGLEGWEKVKVKIGVTGNSGVGKSTFINTIRGFRDDEEGAAKTDVVETTLEPKKFIYDTEAENQNIELWDLPGIGTTNLPDLDHYCEKVNLTTYDTFLILTSDRFTNHELDLAKKVKAEGKSFFLVRTKIDEAVRSENRRREPNVDAMLQRIRHYCVSTLNDRNFREDEIFLISNLYDEISKWEFNRLVNAILDKLPTHQKEALTLSLKILSKDIVTRKVQSLQSRSWRVTLLLFVKLPLKKLHSTSQSSHDISKSKIEEKVKDYRSKLGFPEQASGQFKALKPEFQEKMKIFYPKGNKDFWEMYFVPRQMIGKPGISEFFTLISGTEGSLRSILCDMEDLAKDILSEASA